MKTTRQAVMKVSRQLLEQLMPDWETAAQLRYGQMIGGRFPADVDVISIPYHMALKLPDSCSITGISSQLHFYSDEIAFRIESPDFVETEHGCRLPEVQAVYQNKYEFNFKPTVEVQLQSATGYFLCWAGPAVAVQRTYGPDGKEVPRLEVQRIEFDPSDDWGITELFENTKKDAVRQETKRQAAFCEIECNKKLGVIHQPPPNPLMTWDEYRAAVNWCVTNGGVAYVWKVNNAVGEAERWVLPPGRVLKWENGGYCVNLDRGKVVLLPAESVEILASPLGPATADGEHGMRAVERWLLSTARFQEEADRQLKAASVGYGAEGLTLNEVRALRWLKPRPIPPREKLEKADGYCIPLGGSTEELEKYVDKLLMHDPDGLPAGPPENDTDSGGRAERSIKSVPANPEAVIKCFDDPSPADIARSAFEPGPCWRCHNPTIRRLPDGVAECQECAGKSLL